MGLTSLLHWPLLPILSSYCRFPSIALLPFLLWRQDMQDLPQSGSLLLVFASRSGFSALRISLNEGKSPVGVVNRILTVLLVDSLAPSVAPPWFSHSLPSLSYRSLRPQSPRGPALTWTPVPPWVLGSVSTAREICPAGETQTTLKSRVKYQAGAPLLLLLTALRMKATSAQQSSLWCSLWPLLHSFSAESTWLRSTSLTMNYEQCATSSWYDRGFMEFESGPVCAMQKGRWDCLWKGNPGCHWNNRVDFLTRWVCVWGDSCCVQRSPETLYNTDRCVILNIQQLLLLSVFVCIATSRMWNINY